MGGTTILGTPHIILGWIRISGRKYSVLPCSFEHALLVTFFWEWPLRNHWACVDLGSWKPTVSALACFGSNKSFPVPRDFFPLPRTVFTFVHLGFLVNLSSFGVTFDSLQNLQHCSFFAAMNFLSCQEDWKPKPWTVAPSLWICLKLVVRVLMFFLFTVSILIQNPWAPSTGIPLVVCGACILSRFHNWLVAPSDLFPPSSWPVGRKPDGKGTSLALCPLAWPSWSRRRCRNSRPFRSSEIEGGVATVRFQVTISRIFGRFW